jgi:flagellar basal-body rod modification protein FlgD
MSTGIGGMLTSSNLDALNKIANDAVNNQKLKSQSLGKDAFLELMMTQLAHQDPLSPLDNQEMIAQMAQFSSVEQMGLVNENMQKNTEQNDLILEAILAMNTTGSTSGTEDKIDSLIEKTDRANEINTNILNELLKLNKAMEAYNE